MSDGETSEAVGAAARCLAGVPAAAAEVSTHRFSSADNVEAELLHTFTKVYKFDTMLLLVRLAVLTAVTLTVPIVLFPVSPPRAPSAARARVHHQFFKFPIWLQIR